LLASFPYGTPHPFRGLRSAQDSTSQNSRTSRSRCCLTRSTDSPERSKDSQGARPRHSSGAYGASCTKQRSCPLWVKSGSSACHPRMSAFDPKRTKGTLRSNVLTRLGNEGNAQAPLGLTLGDLLSQSCYGPIISIVYDLARYLPR